MPRSLSDGLIRRAQAAGQRYIILSEFREKNVLDLRYRWVGQASLKKQAKGLAIFEVPERPAENPEPVAGSWAPRRRVEARTAEAANT